MMGPCLRDDLIYPLILTDKMLSCLVHLFFYDLKYYLLTHLILLDFSVLKMCTCLTLNEEKCFLMNRVEMLRRYLPFSELEGEGLQVLIDMAARFEENVYTAARTQVYMTRDFHLNLIYAGETLHLYII